ncbi:MAG: malectin domain-containing carbohydrate-binding protein [Bryobacteraceae bacterium]
MAVLDFLPLSDARSDAVKALLGSGVFERSKGQERLFLYLCEKCFSGQAEELKEFTIATEAFGRPAEFDPKDDSIVRVEMHRLRKRLREHYQGKSDAVRILLPEKSYQLDFQFPVPVTPVVVAEPVPPVVAEHWWRRWVLPVGVGVLLMAVIGAATMRREAVREIPVVAKTAPAPVTPEKPLKAGKALRILCGRPVMRYTDPYGNVWEGDRFYQGGEPLILENMETMQGYDANVLGGLRQGNFRYSIPLEPGTYEVMLIFAEPPISAGPFVNPADETREFGVSFNGKPVLRNFDVKDEVGGYHQAHFRVFKDVKPGVDGKLEIQFSSGSQRAFVNGIVVRPGTVGKLLPVRIVARPQPYVDAKGNVWEADLFYRGGRQIVRPVPPSGTPDARLYVGERHGTFQYAIPVAEGRYRVNLHFWEFWWSKAGSGNGKPGDRVFDVFCNFRPLLQRFDLLAERPANNVVTKSFTGLRPDGQGRLVLSFVPHANRAMVNAIEVVEE